MGTPSSALTKPKRPLAITFVSVFILLLILFNLLSAALIFIDLQIAVRGALPPLVQTGDQLTLTVEGEKFGEMLSDLAVAIVLIVIGIGFWQQRAWGWVGAISWTALRLAMGLVRFIDDRELSLAMIFGAVVVFALIQPDVRKVFVILPSPEPPAPDEATNASRAS